ncbi:putative sugar O-methyltransferase [Paraburkholderia sp. BCC1884]|uniref:putative sugar O-methyltransferase n=1 Tax=Paraburkholderia sp. BCC1884 TaxID=2562668 RepID=UPI001182DB8E|nr:putative sugar O-methyltransferase [Paraburkholderia sp. BCC1884]
MPQVKLPDDFNADDYLTLNPDVMAAGVEPATHYLHYGHEEGREYKRSTDHRALFLKRMSGLENFTWLLNRMPSYLPPALALSPNPGSISDQNLVLRVMTAYRNAVERFAPTDGFWDIWHCTIKKPIHDALSGDDADAATRVLRDPASSVFFWGFDAIASSPEGEVEPHELVLTRLNKQTDWRELYAYWISDALVTFAEAIGARKVAYPEFEVDTTLASRSVPFNVDSLLDEIEAELGIQINFPNPYPNELGIPSKRGVIGFRSVQSLYQGWRIGQLAQGNPDFRVMEIGAGLGRTAYFARQFGVKNYTIVDLPLTNAAQGYFLGRVLGDSEISLGAENGGGPLRVISNTAIDGHQDKYDLIVNVDSWTEMPKDVAQSYWDFARKATRTVLSINHEFNAHTVRELYRGAKDARATRYAYPMRRGYVEEVITW